MLRPDGGGRFRLVLAPLRGAVGVNEREEEVELVEQLGEPLHREVRGRDYQGALDDPCVEQRGEHQARLDRLPQADLVGEDEAGLRGYEYMMGDRDLVRLHVDAARE